MRVLITRPQPQATRWAQSLREAGLEALALPLMAIAPPADPAPVVAAWRRLADWDAVMAVSAQAVAHFAALRPDDVPLTQWAEGPRWWVTGPGSAAALRQAGVPQARIDAPAPDARVLDSEALWRVVGPGLKAGARVLVVRGDVASPDEDAAASSPVSTASKFSTDASASTAPNASEGVGREWLAQQVRGHGGTVDFLVAYRRCLPSWGPQAVALAQVAAADGTLWVFSSSEAIQNLRALAPGQSWARARALASHPRIAQAAREAGFGWVGETRPALPDLIASIESLA